MLNKVIRTVTSVLPVEENRSGECNNCGACCKLPFRCIFLKTDDKGRYYCKIYNMRPSSCRKFPRNQRQLDEVADSCGFKFNESAK